MPLQLSHANQSTQQPQQQQQPQQSQPKKPAQPQPQRPIIGEQIPQQPSTRPAETHPSRNFPHINGIIKQNQPTIQVQQPQQQQQQSRVPTPGQTVAQAVPEPTKRPPSDRELMVAKKEQGNKKFRCNAFDDAVRCYRAALEISRKLEDKEMAAVLHFNLAMSYDKLGSYAQAADECAEAVKINDQYIKAHVKRAEIYMARGRFDEAVICYEHICELDSSKRADAMQRIAKAKALAAKMKKPDQYEILGLLPHFSADQLKTAYKQKARAHHPDRHSDADVVTRRIHEKIFKEASEANTYFRKRFNFH